MTDPTARYGTDDEWDELLRPWRTQPAAGPRPFFYGRVRARLERATAARQQARTAWLRRTAYAALLGALLLGLSGDSAAAAASPAAGRGGLPSALPVR